MRKNKPPCIYWEIGRGPPKSKESKRKKPTMDFMLNCVQDQGQNRRIRWEGEMEMGLKEGNNGERATIEEHLRDGMENQCSGNFLKYMKVILMTSPSNEGDIGVSMYDSCLITCM